MSKRKTLEVRQLLDYANNQLSRVDEYATKEFKEGIIVMVEYTLHRTGNYNGFRFLNNDDSEVGTIGYCSRYYY